MALITQRIRPGLSLLIAVFAASGFFGLLFLKGYTNAEAFVAHNSLENQIARYLANAAVSEPQHNQLQNMQDLASMPIQDLIGADREIKQSARADACLKHIMQVVGSPVRGNNWLRFSPEASRQLMADEACEFYEPRVSDNLFVNEYLKQAVHLGVIVFLLCLLAFWVVTYPHRGWRRAAAASGLLCGFFSSIYVFLDNTGLSLGALAFPLIAIVMSAVMVLLARETMLWIRRGFGEGEPGI
jgi:hypothetical protein